MVQQTFSKPPPVPVQSRPSLPRGYAPISTRDLPTFRRSRSLTPLGSSYASRYSSRESLTSTSRYSSRESLTSIGSSRDTSPYRSTSSLSSNPIYLRTSYACKYPYVKSVSLGKVPQILHFGIDSRVINADWESAETFYLTSGQNNQRRCSETLHNSNLFECLPKQGISFVPDTHETKDIRNQWFPHSEKATTLTQKPPNHQSMPCQQIAFFVDDLYLVEQESVFHQIPKTENASASEQKSSKLDLIQPTKLKTHNPLLMIKKAILPKTKYRWEEGFRQGPTGWAKVPLLKLKFKYKEEDLDLVPPILSVEGGRWCETKRVELDQGKGKIKLKSSEGAAPQIRVVPLSRDGRQDNWVPEFLFSVDTPNTCEKDKSSEEKWCKVKLSPAMPE